MTEQTTLELARQYLQGATKPTIYADHAAGVCLISELLSLCESLESDLSRHIEIASEAQTELAQARKDAARFAWMLDNMGLAELFLAEATNTDTYGKRRDEDILPSVARRHVRERIDDEMEESAAIADAAQKERQ
jgi:hypothetical protein